MAHARLSEKLRNLARNLWWTWQPSVNQIFRDLDPELWNKTNHNPVEFLQLIPPDQIERRASEKALHSRIDTAFRRLNEYLENKRSWGLIHANSLATRPVAYFSMEFGLHESLPIYSGGLGVLAGDHLKSASDLGIPLVGVGLLYNQGYFRQALDQNGWQQESYLNAEKKLLPIEPALDPLTGHQLLVAVETRESTLHARVWRVEVGRRTLLLLDSDVPENNEYDRSLTARLYGGDARVRIRQELLLGVGGLRALQAMGIHPGVIHLNEGHSAFATLEMIRIRMEEQGDPFGVAQREVASMTVFTTHTPVAAGHDRFHADLVEQTLGKLRESMHLSYEGLMALGRIHPHDHNEPFCMTVLALKLSRHANGVSALHGEISRQMWHPLFPHKTIEEVPIGHITNGVHDLSWLAPSLRELYDRHMGADWPRRTRRPEAWEPILDIDEGELWETHQVLKARLIDFVRNRQVMQAQRRGEPDAVIERLRNVLDLETLTIGFARRFATYKRAGLVMLEPDRLAEMVNSVKCPIQLVFAGKAHPEDRYGKELIQSIVRLSRDPRFEHRMVFIEDYDMNVARHLVQGVDVWLNNPRRPQEASGTSGEKAMLNGILNCSVLDGWWAEAYDGTNGFAIGRGLTHQDIHIQDQRDHRDLIKVLQEEVVPAYYRRNSHNLPSDWIMRQKRGIRAMGWRFSADRMVVDYAEHGYLPASGGRTCRFFS